MRPFSRRIANLGVAVAVGVAALPGSADAQQKDGSGQDSPASGGLPVLKLDLVTRTFDKPLPFDQPFYVQVPIGTSKVAIGRLTYGYPKGTDTTQVFRSVGTEEERLSDVVGSSVATFRIRALKANRTVVFSIEVVNPAADSVAHMFRTFERNATRVAQILAVGRTATTFKDHFRTDIGFNYAPTLLTGVSHRNQYAGGGSSVHVYLAPINEQERLADVHKWDHVLKRVSLFGGLDIFDLKSGVPIDHMFTPGTPVAGIGIKPWFHDDWQIPNSMFLNVGVMWFNQKDANPLLGKEHGKRTRYVGIGGNVDWKDILGPLAFLVGGKS